jgi:hypothetical protein
MPLLRQQWHVQKKGGRKVDRIKAMDNVQLHKELRRLERDVEDFRVRAATVEAMLERSGRSVMSDPLHQRLTSIHEFLRRQLEDAGKEAAKRAAAPRARPRRQRRARDRGALSVRCSAALLRARERTLR